LRKKVEEIKAPFEADVCEIYVEVGDEVSVGQVVLTIEAMKMQSPIESKVDGVIEHIWVRVGQNVSVGDRLISILTED
jgi:biotin carboxyl carrier protein